MGTIEVAPESSAFAAVLRLWRGESATLGYMPEGGFVDAASDHCLLAAESESGGLAGYVMYRRSTRGIATIVHLCVAPCHRGFGSGRALFEAVKRRCADCYEIRVRCRRDFPANDMWPKLGFVAVQDVSGRELGATITVWRYELNALPLFSRLGIARSASAVRVVIDANVFFDLDDSADGDEESRSLSADWLGEFVELAVTQELFNEIHRNPDAIKRERQRGRASRFAQIPREVGREEAVLPRINALLLSSDKASALSDARQIAMTVAGDVSFFATRDNKVLAAADAVEEAFGWKRSCRSAAFRSRGREAIRRFRRLRILGRADGVSVAG